MSKLPDPWRDLTSELRQMQREIRELRNRSPFTGTGLTPTADGGIELQGVPLDPLASGVARASVSNPGRLERHKPPKPPRAADEEGEQ